MDTSQDTIFTESQPTMRPGLFVLLGGIATTVIALFIVAWVSFATDGDVNLMGFYLWFFIPVSAIAVGWVAGTGYSLVSKLRGIRIGIGMLLIVTILMIAAYFVAQYADYAALSPEYEDGTPVGFWEFFDFVTQSYTYSSGRNSLDEPKALGTLGYGLRALEIIGFSLGGLLPLISLRGNPYCNACQRYMKKHKLCSIAASPAKIDKKNIKAILEEGAESANIIIEQLAKSFEDGDIVEFRNQLAELLPKSKDAKKRLAHIDIAIYHCTDCFAGHMEIISICGKHSGSEATKIKLPIVAGVPKFIQAYVQTINSPQSNDTVFTTLHDSNKPDSKA